MIYDIEHEDCIRIKITNMKTGEPIKYCKWVDTSNSTCAIIDTYKKKGNTYFKLDSDGNVKFKIRKIPFVLHISSQDMVDRGYA